MRHCALRVLASGMALALMGANLASGGEPAAYATSNGRDSVSAAQPRDACVTLTDRSGQRVLAQGSGAIVGTSSTRQCPSATISAQPERVPGPAAALSAPPDVPAPAPEAETPAESPPAARAPKPRMTAPPTAQSATAAVAAEPALPHLAPGRVALDRDGSRAPRRPEPLLRDVTPGRLTASVVTGGSVIILLHSGLWTSLLILGLPLWRHVDLLPICERGPDDPGTADATAVAQAEGAVADVLQPKKRSTGVRT